MDTAEIATSRRPNRASAVIHKYFTSPIRWSLDKVWHFLAYIIVVFLLGNVLFNIIWSLATTGSLGIADPTTWVVLQPILLHPFESMVAGAAFVMVGAVSFWAHSLSHKAPPPPEDLVPLYHLNKVQAVSPTPRYIAQYRSFYLSRSVLGTGEDADNRAQQALQRASQQQDMSDTSALYGFCVTGRRLLGSTRLAWKAFKDSRELANWTFVEWPEDPQQYGEVLDYLKQQGQPVLIWLDSLGRYLKGANPRFLNYLPYALLERRLRFVIVATCHDQDYPEVKVALNDLLSHLTAIPLADITAAQSEELSRELARSGATVSAANQYDGTPGALILGVTHMRDEVYPKLEDKPRMVLRTLKLLRSAGITDYPTARVLRVTHDLFAPTTDDWTEALRELSLVGFIGQRSTISGDTVATSPTQEVYLSVAVPDYADPGSPPDRDWPRLADSLASAQDTKALLRLGDACRARDLNAEAQRCYESALAGLSQQAAPLDWARGKLGSGITLARSLDDAQGKVDADILKRAEEALRDALTVITEESMPDLWAEAQGGLAIVVRQTARTTQGPQRRQRLLDRAAASSRAALRILKRATAPEDWADAHYNLALILQTHASLVGDARLRRDMLDGAADACRHALEVYTPDYRYKRARVQRCLGDVLSERAPSSQRKAELYEEAIKAYSDTLILLGDLHGSRFRADSLAGRAAALRDSALLQDTSQKPDMLRRAEADYLEASKVYEQLPDALNQYARSLSDRGGTLRWLAAIDSSDEKAISLDESTQLQVQALRALGQKGSYDLHSIIHWELANSKREQALLFGQSGDKENACKRLAEAGAQVEKALQYSNPEVPPGMQQQAERLKRDIERDRRTLGCPRPRQ
jgi:tetratricopeptide (TPR) repeat protein